MTLKFFFVKDIVFCGLEYKVLSHFCRELLSVGKLQHLLMIKKNFKSASQVVCKKFYSTRSFCISIVVSSFDRLSDNEVVDVDSFFVLNGPNVMLIIV